MGLVTRDMACHVLWQFSEGTVAERHRPGDFVEQLLATIVQADPFNLQLLSRSFPGYVWAVRQMRADETGIFLGQLRAVARGEEKLPAEVETVAQREQRAAPAGTARREAQVMARQSVDGGEVVGIETMPGAEDENQGKQGNPFIGQIHGWRASSAWMVGSLLNSSYKIHARALILSKRCKVMELSQNREAGAG